MNKNITLVIMAAGLGSRFGGLKQLAPMGPNNEFIIDYSVFDAIKAGFNKIIFIIKRENYDVFKETIGKRVEPHIHVEYVFQELNNLPSGYSVPAEREKPLGTAHAILCVKDKVKEPFAVINADDFYGRDAFIKAYMHLSHVNIESNNYGMIGYEAGNTITANGSVKRGVCVTDETYYLKEIIESSVEKVEGKIIASPLDGRESFEIPSNRIVSMNFLLFTPTLFKYLEEFFPVFFEKSKDNMLKSEFLIPDVLQELINSNKANCEVIKTKANWYGVTYKEDTESVRSAIQSLVDDGQYNTNLWD